MREEDRYDEETPEIYIREIEKSRRMKRIQKKKKDKRNDYFSEGNEKRPKHQRTNRKKDKDSLQNILKQYR